MRAHSLEQQRVLYVTYIVPWRPRYGGALRCSGVIQGLAARCDLHVALASDAAPEIEAFLTWSAPSNVTRHVLSPVPRWDGVDDGRASRTIRAAIGRGKYHSALQQLERTLRPDIVWFFEVEVLRRTGLPSNAPAILDHCDVRWRKQLRLAHLETGAGRSLAFLKAALLRLDDAQLAMRVAHSLVASQEEVRLLWPARSVSVLPNGFHFQSTAPSRLSDNHRLLFLGSLFYRPNADGVRWLCREVWSLVRARLPAATLDVVGLGQETLTDLMAIPGVTFHGFVDDLDGLLSQAAALVVPLRIGGGTRIKILEAWAKGLPVVSTTVGAEGLAAQDGVTALLGDTPATFAANCVAILEDRELRQRLTAAAYDHGRRWFDWTAVWHSLDPIIGWAPEEQRGLSC